MNMIGLKNFSTCNCNLPPTRDEETSDGVYRFICGKLSDKKTGSEAIEDACEHSLTIEQVQRSNTIPTYYTYKITKTEQQFESFHMKPLKGYLEWCGFTKKRTLEKSIATLETAVMEFPKHNIACTVIDVVEKEDVQQLLERLLLYAYIAVLEERVHSTKLKNCDGCLFKEPSQFDHQCCTLGWIEKLEIYLDYELELLFTFDYEAVLRWHDIINRMSRICSGLEIFDAYRSFRKDTERRKNLIKNIMLHAEMFFESSR